MRLLMKIEDAYMEERDRQKKLKRRRESWEKNEPKPEKLKISNRKIVAKQPFEMGESRGVRDDSSNRKLEAEKKKYKRCCVIM